MVKYLEAVDMASIVYVYVPSFPGAFVWRFWDLINPLLGSELAARLTVDTEKPHSEDVYKRQELSQPLLSFRLPYL